MRTPKNRRAGFVLLLTMFLVAIAGLLLAGVARSSLRLAVDSVQSQEGLQRRFGALSCRRTLLAHAERVLQRQATLARCASADSLDPPASLPVRLALGGLTFELLLADETAKVSLNTIHREQGPEALQRLIEETARGALPVRLRPYRTGGEGNSTIALDSWGQVFALERLEDSPLVTGSLAQSTGEMTCWGDGKLNLERAPESAVLRIAGLVLEEEVIQRLLAVRRRHWADQAALETDEAAAKTAGAASADPQAIQNLKERKKRLTQWLTQALSGLGLRAGQVQQLGELLTDRSTCHSLWITIHDRNRTWRQLCLRMPRTAGAAKEYSFSW